MAVNDFSEEASTPSTPTAGRWKLYPKSTGWFFLDDAGVETSLTAGLTSSTKLPTVGCTQAAGALTFTAASMYLDFRSATLTSGTPSTVLAAPANLVLPSGGTLGFTTLIEGTILIAEMNNAGTTELAICNKAGGLQTDESNLISTTAIGTGSDSANVWYSTTARTNLPYKIIGEANLTNTAGAWGDATKIQPAGGLASGVLATRNALNVAGDAPMFACRAWVNFTASTGAILASGNVSGVVRNGTGDWTITFSTPLPDVNYAFSYGAIGAGAVTAVYNASLNTNTFRFETRRTDTLAEAEPGGCTVSFFR